MKKYIISLITLFLLLGCETGVQNQNRGSEPILSGIVDRSDLGKTENYSSIQSSQKTSKQGSNKIFSKTAQPGYYLQVAFFAKNKPSKAFLSPIESSGLGYTVLEKHHGWYVLVGAYKSYNAAKSQVATVKSKLNKQSFVVQVLRP